MPADDELIFYEGCKPIRAKKNWFFKDKMFKERAGMAPVKIEMMAQDAKQFAAAKKNDIRVDGGKESGWLR